MMEDRILVWRFRRGGREALERIYCKYEAMLLTVATAVLGDPAGAQDVVQDVFLDLVRTPGRIRLGGNLRAFLAVCVANRARDRRRGRRRDVCLDDLDLTVPETQQPEVVAASQETLRLAWSGLAGLPEEQREVLVLHLVAGLRFRQIAATLEVSINTVQSRYRYGLAKLRTLFNGQVR